MKMVSQKLAGTLDIVRSQAIDGIRALIDKSEDEIDNQGRLHLDTPVMYESDDNDPNMDAFVVAVTPDTLIVGGNAIDDPFEVNGRNDYADIDIEVLIAVLAQLERQTASM